MILNEKELENLPLKARQDTLALKNVFAKLGFDNSDYITILPPDGVNIVNFIAKDKRFHFKVFHPKYFENDKVTRFQFSYAPFTDSSLITKSGNSPINSVVNNFNNWINLLKALDQVNAELQDSFLKQFKDEFFAEYVPTQNEEDYVKTFSDGILDILSEVLESVQMLLEQEAKEEEKDDVIAKVIELKNNLQITSKAGIRKSVVELLALTKRYGFKAAFSYLIDKLFGGGMDILVNSVKRLSE